MLRHIAQRGIDGVVVIGGNVSQTGSYMLSQLGVHVVGFELRATTLGHVVRGAPPSAFDRILATRLGVNTAKSLSDGETGVLIGWQKNEVTRTSLADIVGSTKPIDTERVELARILAK
jgi:6-phosphofructokinase 1